MKKLIAILALSLSLLLCLTACGSKMPYDLSGTVSVELHAYNLDPVSHFLGFCFLETAQGYAAIDKLPNLSRTYRNNTFRFHLWRNYWDEYHISSSFLYLLQNCSIGHELL